MRRQLRGYVPELAHWFHLSPWDLDDLTYGEVEELTERLRRLPPIGGNVPYEVRKK